MVSCKVFKVRETSDSLRTTIPSEFVVALKLKHGDDLEWELDVKDGKIVAVARRG